jgi:hypothetical protein
MLLSGCAGNINDKVFAQLEPFSPFFTLRSSQPNGPSIEVHTGAGRMQASIGGDAALFVMGRELPAQNFVASFTKNSNVLTYGSHRRLLFVALLNRPEDLSMVQKIILNEADLSLNPQEMLRNVFRAIRSLRRDAVVLVGFLNRSESCGGMNHRPWSVPITRPEKSLIDYTDDDLSSYVDEEYDITRYLRDSDDSDDSESDSKPVVESSATSTQTPSGSRNSRGQKAPPVHQESLFELEKLDTVEGSVNSKGTPNDRRAIPDALQNVFGLESSHNPNFKGLTPETMAGCSCIGVL